jgi:hypothetical protein
MSICVNYYQVHIILQKYIKPMIEYNTKVSELLSLNDRKYMIKMSSIITTGLKRYHKRALLPV